MSNELNQIEGQDDVDNVDIYKGGKVIKVFAERERKGTKNREFLCRFQNKSFLHLEWLTLDEIKERDILMSRITKKNK